MQWLSSGGGVLRIGRQFNERKTTDEQMAQESDYFACHFSFVNFLRTCSFLLGQLCA